VGKAPERTSAAKAASASTEAGLEVGVAAHELGRDAVLDAEHVVEHEHLAVAARPGADADGGDVDRVGDHAGHLVGHALEHDGEAAGGGQGLGVGDQGHGGVVLLPCTLNPPMACTDWGVRPRWPITGISASRMASIMGQALAPALELHRLGAGAHQRGGVAHRLVDGDTW
jgi:hypothetical protein